MRVSAPSAAFVIVLALGCLLTIPRPAPQPHLVDQCGIEQNVQDSAPIVIVGVIAADMVVRRPLPMQSDPTYPLQLRMMRLKVENVLKGRVPAAVIAVYYYAFAGGFDGPQPLGMWRGGSRRVFWLRSDKGVLRTACDGWDDCTIGVYSGSHTHLSFTDNRPVDYAVADILLTRGEGNVNDSKFAGALDRGAPGPETYLIVRYRHLAMTERVPVKTAACAQLWIIAQDRLPSEVRRSAADAMHDAGCQCVTKPPRGELDCGPTKSINDGPPW